MERDQDRSEDQNALDGRPAQLPLEEMKHSDLWEGGSTPSLTEWRGGFTLPHSTQILSRSRNAWATRSQVPQHSWLRGFQAIF